MHKNPLFLSRKLFHSPRIFRLSKKKKNEILYSSSNYLSLQNFFAIAHFEIDRASFNFTPWKGIDKNSASIDFLQEKKKKRKRVKVSKNPLSLG